MKLLADENIPHASISYLRDRSYDVLSIAETAPGLDDLAVLAQAAEEKRLLLTFDRDYGKLIYSAKASCPPGLVYLRFRPRWPTETGEVLEQLLHLGDLAVVGYIVVLDREGFRRRLLP